MQKEYLDEFLHVYEALKTIFGFEQVSMCIHEKDEEWYAAYAEHTGEGVYDICCIPERDGYRGVWDRRRLRPADDQCLLFIPKGTKSKDYADVETESPEEGIFSLVGELLGMRMPLGGCYLEPVEPLFSESEEVDYEQKIGEPVNDGFSLGVWASAEGTISSIEDDIYRR